MHTTFIKKIALMTAIISASAQAIASPLGTFYVKIGGGMNIMSKHKGRIQTYRSDLAGLAEVGIGYSILDNVRADLTFTHYFSPEHTASTSSPNRTTKISGNLKANINTYMIGAYVDLVDVKMVKLFLGAGLGLAQVKQKYYYEVTTSNNMLIRKNSGSTKQANNFSYALTGGIATTIAPIADIELACSWNDLGKTKSRNNGPTMRYQGYNLVGRLKFNI